MPGPPMTRATRVNIFVSAIVVLAGVVVALTLGLPQRPLEWSWWGAVLLLIASRVAEAGIGEFTRESDEAGYGVSLATVPQLACALLLPAPFASPLSGSPLLSSHSPILTPIPP